jgi:hypothetical protein
MPTESHRADDDCGGLLHIYPYSDYHSSKSSQNMKAGRRRLPGGRAMRRLSGKRNGRAAAWLGLVATLSACSQTTRVGDDTTTNGLAVSGKGVAVMRLGAASPSCQHVGVWLGVREGAGFRPHAPVAVMHAGSLASPPIAEVELPPGEYHVVSYACSTGTKTQQIASYDPTTGLVRTSYASFTIATGEVVNVGSFEYRAGRVGTNAFGRPYRVDVSVGDWPLGDIERYRAKRPQIFAQMKTRLMTVTHAAEGSNQSDDCARLTQLMAEGKVQNLPVACRLPAAGASAVAKAAGKSR